MKTQIMKNIKAIILALIVVVGVSYVSADWTAAPASPPNNNVPAPINVGSIFQERVGPLKIYNLLTSLNLLANQFTFSPAIDYQGASPQNRVGKVLTATDVNGKVEWASPAGLNAVTSIKAGNNITVSPCTGDPCVGSGDLTIGANSIFPKEIGYLTKGESMNFGSDWKVIMLNGQYDPASSGGSDSSPAGAYIMKDGTGNITWTGFLGQREINSCPAKGTRGSCTGSSYVGIDNSGARIIVNISSSSVTVTAGGTVGSAGVQLSYIVFN
jgi:hypothetical protein